MELPRAGLRNGYAPRFAIDHRLPPDEHPDVDINFITPAQLPSAVQIPGLRLGVLPFTQEWGLRSPLWQEQAQLLLIARAVGHDPFWASAGLGGSVFLRRLAQHEQDVTRMMMSSLGRVRNASAFAAAVREREGDMAAVVAGAENALLGLLLESDTVLGRGHRDEFRDTLHCDLREKNDDAIRTCRAELAATRLRGGRKRRLKGLVHAIDLALDSVDERRRHRISWCDVLKQQVFYYILWEVVVADARDGSNDESSDLETRSASSSDDGWR